MGLFGGDFEGGGRLGPGSEGGGDNREGECLKDGGGSPRKGEPSGEMFAPPL